MAVKPRIFEPVTQQPKKRLTRQDKSANIQNPKPQDKQRSRSEVYVRLKLEILERKIDREEREKLLRSLIKETNLLSRPESETEEALPQFGDSSFSQSKKQKIIEPIQIEEASAAVSPFLALSPTLVHKRSQPSQVSSGSAGAKVQKTTNKSFEKQKLISSCRIRPKVEPQPSEAPKCALF